MEKPATGPGRRSRPTLRDCPQRGKRDHAGLRRASDCPGVATASIHLHTLASSRGSRKASVLVCPTNHVSRVKYELGPATLDILHNLARDPLATLQPEHRTAH